MDSAVPISIITREAFRVSFHMLTLLNLPELEQRDIGLLLGVLHGLPCLIMLSFFFSPAAIFQGSSVLTLL